MSGPRAQSSQPFRPAFTLSVPTSKSAEIPNFVLTRRIIGNVSARLRFITSDTLARLPIIGSRSFRVSP